jgi:hypothetical protein
MTDPEHLTPAQRKALARKRLDEVFGDVLPEQSSDDQPDPRESRSSDDWLRAQVPPHHG